MSRIISAWFPKRNGKYERAYHELKRKPEGKIIYDFNFEKDRLLFLENNNRGGGDGNLPPIIDVEENDEGIKYIFKIVEKNCEFKMSLNDWCDMYFLAPEIKEMTKIEIREQKEKQDKKYIDELIKNENFDLLKYILSRIDNIENMYLYVAEKLFDHDIKYKSIEAINTFIWLDLCDDDFEKEEDEPQNNFNLGYYLQHYIDDLEYDKISIILTLPKITLNLKPYIDQLIPMKNEIEYKKEYEKYFNTIKNKKVSDWREILKINALAKT